MDLARVGDRADPRARHRRLAEQRAECRRVGLVLRVDPRPERQRALFVRRWPWRTVLAVTDRPQPQRVGRPARHRPRAATAQQRRGADECLVLVGERVGDHVGDATRDVDRRRTPVALSRRRGRLAPRVRSPGRLPDHARCSHGILRSCRRVARWNACASRKRTGFASRHRLWRALASSRQARHHPPGAPQSGHRPAARRRSRLRFRSGRGGVTRHPSRDRARPSGDRGGTR